MLAGNLTPPLEDRPALLSHRDVVTMFHEFGHLMHHAASRVEVRSLAGTSVAWDFVELPSQIMENWCWEREALDLFARHHETGEAIPPEVLARMRAARTFRAANAMMRQLGFAEIDLALHMEYRAETHGDAVAFSRAILQRFSAAPIPDDHAMITSFSHLFAHPVGYAAGYYSYKWAEVLDADAFSRFQREGLFDRGRRRRLPRRHPRPRRQRRPDGSLPRLHGPRAHHRRPPRARRPPPAHRERRMSDTPDGDRVVRAITEDGAFRVIVARTTETVRGAVAAQGARGPAARHFGELLTGAVLIREAMAPRLRVQAILKGGGGKGTLVADSHPDGTTRGLVNFGVAREGDAREIAVSSGALLQVMRTLPGGSLHQGVVAVPEGGGISSGLMAYMQDSEQVVTTIAVASLFDDDDTLAVAGGYLVQLLPEVERGPLMVMTERLAELQNLDEVLRTHGGSPDALLDELLYGMPFARLEESRLGFACHCSQLRVVASLASLPRADIEDLVRDGEVLEIRCDYCGKVYGIPPAQLRPLLTPS